MSDIQWYIQVEEGKKAGPVPFERLQALAAKGKILPETNIRTADAGSVWKPAGNVPGLFAETAESGAASGEQTLPSIFSDSFSGEGEAAIIADNASDVDEPVAGETKSAAEAPDEPAPVAEEDPKEKSSNVKVRINPLGGSKKAKGGSSFAGVKINKDKSDAGPVSIPSAEKPTEATPQPVEEPPKDGSGIARIAVNPKGGASKGKAPKEGGSKIVVNPFAKKDKPKAESTIVSVPADTTKEDASSSEITKPEKASEGSAVVKIGGLGKKGSRKGGDAVGVAPSREKSTAAMPAVDAPKRESRSSGSPRYDGLRYLGDRLKIIIIIAIILSLCSLLGTFFLLMQVDFVGAVLLLVTGGGSIAVGAVIAFIWIAAIKDYGMLQISLEEQARRQTELLENRNGSQ